MKRFTESIARWLRAYAEKDGRGYPDWAMRYVPIVRRLRRMNRLDGRILEIGANENGLSRFSGRRVIAVDVAVDHLKAARGAQRVVPVAADIAHLPFADGAFDLCVCVDTFEHLPDTARAAATVSILRVLHGDGAAVVAFPSGEHARRAEETVREAHRRFTGGSIRWLEEHRTMGLPDAKAIARQFEGAAGDARRISMESNVPVRLWTWMWLVLMGNWPGRGNAVAQAALRLITPVLCAMRWGTAYRCVIWILPK
ncbi:MAG: hypothetical protein AMXMBFR84_07250 [Candidatus Hydrogenedentota bacterium]